MSKIFSQFPVRSSCSKFLPFKKKICPQNWCPCALETTQNIVLRTVVNWLDFVGCRSCSGHCISSWVVLALNDCVVMCDISACFFGNSVSKHWKINNKISLWIWYHVNTCLMIQQTPKPAAQLPSAVPPLLLHSVLLKQVPLLSLSLVDWHSSFWNVTTLNKDITPGMAIKYFVFSTFNLNSKYAW